MSRTPAPAAHPLVLLLLAALVAACSPFRTSFDWDPDVDFGAISTYAWIDPPDDGVVDPLARKRALECVDEALAAKGLQRVDDAPDVLVAVHLGTEQKVRVVDWGYSYGRRFGTFGVSQLDVVEYEEGTLVLDLVHPGSKELVWRGSATGTIVPDAEPAKRLARMREAVEEILERFPPE